MKESYRIYVKYMLIEYGKSKFRFDKNHFNFLINFSYINIKEMKMKITKKQKFERKETQN